MIDPTSYTVADGDGQTKARAEPGINGVAMEDLPRGAAHPFYARLNQILDQHGRPIICSPRILRIGIARGAGSFDDFADAAVDRSRDPRGRFTWMLQRSWTRVWSRARLSDRHDDAGSECGAPQHRAA